MRSGFGLHSVGSFLALGVCRPSVLCHCVTALFCRCRGWLRAALCAPAHCDRPICCGGPRRSARPTSALDPRTPRSPGRRPRLASLRPRSRCGGMPTGSGEIGHPRHRRIGSPPPVNEALAGGGYSIRQAGVPPGGHVSGDRGDPARGPGRGVGDPAKRGHRGAPARDALLGRGRRSLGAQRAGASKRRGAAHPPGKTKPPRSGEKKPPPSPWGKTTTSQKGKTCYSVMPCMLARRA